MLNTPTGWGLWTISVLVCSCFSFETRQLSDSLRDDHLSVSNMSKHAVLSCLDLSKLREWMNEWTYLYTAHITYCLKAVYNSNTWLYMLIFFRGRWDVKIVKRMRRAFSLLVKYFVSSCSRCCRRRRRRHGLLKVVLWPQLRCWFTPLRYFQN